MKYRIDYYAPDGHGPSPADQQPRLHGRETETLREARGLIRAEGCRFGQWIPDAPGVTAYHESRREGCGGWGIIDLAVEREMQKNPTLANGYDL